MVDTEYVATRCLVHTRYEAFSMTIDVVSTRVVVVVSQIQ
jgi:hypothetical protein